MSWYKLVKLAAVEYLYHGTSISNLPSVLSEGLNTQHGLAYDRALDYNTIRTYGGVYFTTNLVTAISSARNANESKKLDRLADKCIVVAFLGFRPRLLTN
jgi:RNA:NAD 2'-phosphotransferase (TPT1/KptA family)